jgi:hypothetical protein
MENQTNKTSQPNPQNFSDLSSEYKGAILKPISAILKLILWRIAPYR